MKINRLETHDRYEYFIKQDFSISECCQDMINKRPFGNHPFYIFAHARTDDDGLRKRLIWQPRLTKPKAQLNSMLFKAYPGTDQIRIIWMLPALELIDQYKKGNVTHNPIVDWSISTYKNNRKELEANEPDDLSEEQINSIYKSLSVDAKSQKHMVKLYSS